MLMPVRRNLGHVFSIIFFGGLFVLLMIEPKNVLPGTVSITVSHPWKQVHTPKPYNDTKLALLIENRVQSHLTPLLLHFMAVVPPDWPFMFMGSEESIAHINKSAPIRAYEKRGKLIYKLIPENITINNQEEVSATMTNAEFYKMLHPAEWLFLFQTDSIICANSGASLNEWVDNEYTWVGASWGEDTKYGGNGGFSLRRVSHILEVLEHQTRFEKEAFEDWWLTDRLGHMPGTHMANGTEEKAFSVEKVPYPNPIGYHTGWGGRLLMKQVWAERSQRDQIFEYCPEIKMLMPLVLNREAEGCGEKDLADSFPS